jgi:hypothetical protein
MHRWRMTLLLWVVAALLSGCVDEMVAQRLGTLAAKQFTGGKGGAAKAVSTPPTPAPRPRVTATPTEEPTAETPEPTVDYRALGEATLLEGGCFQGFVLYPGATASRQAQASARSLAGMLEDSQTAGYSTEDTARQVQAFYETMPARANWEASPYAGEQQGGGVYYWGKPTKKLLVITLVSNPYGPTTQIMMACGRIK